MDDRDREALESNWNGPDKIDIEALEYKEEELPELPELPENAIEVLPDNYGLREMISERLKEI